MALELVCELTLADGTERFSLGGVSGKTKFYEPRIIRFGPFNIQVPEIPGDARLSDTSIVLDDTDRYFSKSKAGNSYRNVGFKWLVGDLSRGESDLTEVYSGRVSNFEISQGSFTISVRQDSFPKLLTALTGKIDRVVFPDIPNTTPLNLIPWVAGVVDPITNTGEIPAYLIDPGVGQSKFRYVAAQGYIREVKNIYKYGVKQTSAVASSNVTYSGTKYTFIDFDSDARDASRPDEIEVTWDGTGVTADGTASGTPITNPARQLESFLLNNGFEAADLDSTAFTTAESRFGDRGIVGGVVITGAGGETVRSITERFTDSFSMYIFPAKDGTLAVSTVSPPPADTSSLQTIFEHEISAGSFRVTGTQEYASRVAYNFARNHVTGAFMERSAFEDPSQTSNFGVVVEAPPLELEYVRLNSVASAIAQDKVYFMNEERQVVDILVNPDRYDDVSIGDQILLTHRDGLSADNKGYEGTVFQVIGYGFVLTGSDSFMLSLKLVDLIAATFSQEGFERQWETGFYSNRFSDLLHPGGLFQQGMTRVPMRFS